VTDLFEVGDTGNSDRHAMLRNGSEGPRRRSPDELRLLMSNANVLHGNLKVSIIETVIVMVAEKVCDPEVLPFRTWLQCHSGHAVSSRTYLAFLRLAHRFTRSLRCSPFGVAVSQALATRNDNHCDARDLAAVMNSYASEYPPSNLSRRLSNAQSGAVFAVLPIASMLPVEGTESSVRRRFVGSYRASNSRPI